jgi:hypothetical protein
MQRLGRRHAAESRATLAEPALQMADRPACGVTDCKAMANGVKNASRAISARDRAYSEARGDTS